MGQREILALEISEFVWNYDIYEARDCYESYEELITETMRALYDKAKRNVIALWLKEIIEWEEGLEEEIAKAAELYRRVLAI